MDLQPDNKILMSFLLFLDNKILTDGRAFTNSSGLLYKTSGRIDGLNVYTTAYKQLVNDTSVTGATIMSGIKISGSSVFPTQSGLNSINIGEGQAYLSGNPTAISGSFAVKDFSIYMTNKPEEYLLFETKYNLRAKTPQNLSGLSQDAEAYPVVYLKYNNSEDVPFCLGGTDNKQMTIRAIVIGDSQFLTDAACSIMKDAAKRYFKIIEPTSLPFNAYGGFTGVNYNYTGIAAQSSQQSMVWRVRHSSLGATQQFNQLNTKIFPAFVDFDLWTIM